MKKPLLFLISLMVLLFPSIVAADLSEDLVGFWPMNETSGVAIDYVGGNNFTEVGGTIASTTGKIGNGRDIVEAETEYFQLASGMRLFDDSISYSIGGWFKWTSDNANNEPFFGEEGGGNPRCYNGDGGNEQKIYCVVDGIGGTYGGTFVDENWHFIVLVYDSVSSRLLAYKDGTAWFNNTGTPTEVNSSNAFRIGYTHLDYFDGVVDDFFIYHKALSPENITTLYNSSNGYDLLSVLGGPAPTDAFEVTASDTVLESAINEFNISNLNSTDYTTSNGTITTQVNNDGDLFDFNVSSYLYQTLFVYNFSTEFDAQFNLTRYYYANATYDPIVIETDSITIDFVINITDEVDDVNATLTYNNQTRSVTKSVGSNLITFSSTFVAPEIDSNTTFNFTWQFNLSSDYGLTTLDQNYTQLAIPFGVDNCSTYSITAVNFTFLNETDDTETAGDLSGYLQTYIADIGETRAFNLSWGTMTHPAICIDPENARLLSEGQFEYSAPGTNLETYYLTNRSLSSTTDLINLYLTDSATTISFTVTDEDDDPVPSTFIHVAQYDLSTNSFHTTEILKTDSDGEALGNLVLLTQWYKFFLYVDDALVLETDPTKLTSTTKNFRITLGTDYFASYNQALNSYCTLNYNNNTGVFTLSYSESTGVQRNVCLKVTRNSAYSSTTVNESCQTIASGTISLTPTTSNNTESFVGSAYVNIEGQKFSCGNPATASVNNEFRELGNDSLLLTFMLVLTLTMIGIWSPVVAVGLNLFALLAAKILGILFLGWGSVISIVIIVGIALYRMSR